jgi:hypothetical protein
MKIAANLARFQLSSDDLVCSLISAAKKEVWASAILQEEKLDVELVYTSFRKLAVNTSLVDSDVEQLNIDNILCLKWEARVVHGNAATREVCFNTVGSIYYKSAHIQPTKQKTRTAPLLLSNIERRHSILKKLEPSRPTPTTLQSNTTLV